MTAALEADAARAGAAPGAVCAPDPADLAACREVIRVHSKSFHAASKLLPAGVRDAAIATYAFCRGADDDVDDAGSPDAARERHARTRQRLDRLYAGDEMDTPVGRAFAWVVWSRGIPRAEPEALLDGMAQDMSVVRVADEDALLLYCYRAAGVVGRMMSRIMGRADDAALCRAVDLGIAMQLTNIARDVAEDAQRDRVYLPRSALARHGTSPEALVARAHGGPESAAPAGAVAPVVLELLALADRYYHSAELGMRYLPWQVRPAILVAARLYRGIGEVLRQRGGNPWLGRAYVDRSDAARHAASALAALARARRGPHEPDLHHPIRDLPGANASML